ncbi:MAG: hypothetical protein N2039_00650 [Gemmataceae bacterium]|nr:hypothetical protein [Gemmataceae bacterium]
MIDQTPVPARNRKSRVIAAAALAAMIATLCGCSASAPPRTSSREIEREDEVAVVRDMLRREAHLEECKTALAQLNSAFNRPDSARPSALSESEVEFLARKTGLGEDDLKFVQGDQFPIADAYYLEETLLLNEAVRSLRFRKEVASAERAERALGWVSRQVWLLEHSSKPLPTALVLRLGYGNTGERAAVALSVLQQAGIDAGLVAEPKGDRPPRPWAVGVLLDGQVRLWDPRSGRWLVEPNSDRPLTLQQARANPEWVKPLVEAADPGVDFRQVVPASRVGLSPPIFALSARMRWLQTILERDPPVRLAVEASALQGRWRQAGEDIAFWLSAGTPARSLLDYVPVAEGGRSNEAPGARLYERCRMALIPAQQMPSLLRNNEIAGELRDRLSAVFSARFLELALEPRKPRDLILRGQFDEAGRLLNEALTSVQNTQQRVGSQQDLEQDAAAWAKEMQSATAALSRMRDRPQPGDDLAGARARVDTLNKAAGKMLLLIEQAAAEPYAAALTYQMALSLHEQAERQAHDRRSAENKRAAWNNAAGWWNNFLTRFGAAPWIPKPQIEQARSLLAIAQQEAAKP